MDAYSFVASPSFETVYRGMTDTYREQSMLPLNLLSKDITEVSVLHTQAQQAKNKNMYLIKYRVLDVEV